MADIARPRYSRAGGNPAILFKCLWKNHWGQIRLVVLFLTSSDRPCVWGFIMSVDLLIAVVAIIKCGFGYLEQ
ncbi:MAG: hypothetical protein WAQ56_01025 [Candidatus Nitrotoga sp.]